MNTQYSTIKTIELEKGFIELLERNTILLKFKEDGVFELRDAIETNKSIYSIIKVNRFCL